MTTELERPLVYVDVVFEDNLFGGKETRGRFFFQDSTETYTAKHKKCVRCETIQNDTIVWRDAERHKTYCLYCVDVTSATRGIRRDR